MRYEFEAYDVLQIERNGTWSDFSTLRTADDAETARGLVDAKQWNSEAAAFRIVRYGRKEVVYAVIR